MTNAFKIRIDNNRCRIFGDLRQFIYFFVFCFVEPSTVISVQICIMSGIE